MIFRWVPRLIVTGFIVQLAACAPVPDAHKIIAEAEARAVPAIVVAPQGPLSADKSRQLLTRLGVSDALQHQLSIEQALADMPVLSGNSTKVLEDGTATFRAMFRDMNAAKKYINLEYFIFEDVESDGQHLSNLLIAKHRQGVKVRVLYDSFGSSSTDVAVFDRLKKAGIKVLQFNPLNPLLSRGGYAPNSRDHRKILIVDGKVAIVGGVNLSTTYQSSPGKSSGPPGGSAAFWHDTDLELRGPIVNELEALYLQQWEKQDGPELHGARHLAPLGAQGREILHIMGSTPDNKVPLYYTTLLSAMRQAQDRIWLMSAYFVPTRQELEDLEDAARRGIDVRLLLPDDSDSKMALVMQHSHYSDLLKAGIKIYESHNQILHAKTAVIDGVWSVVGSSNFDHRSVVFNDEVDVVVLGRPTGAKLEKIFERDFAKAHVITPEKWRQRPAFQKLRETFEPMWINTFKSSL